MVKAAYPKKQVRTWLMSQLLCRAGMSGCILLLTCGENEAYAIARKANGITKAPRLLLLIRHSIMRYSKTMAHAKKMSDS